ncbi:uncharacterized protein LOC106644989 [Copidosoma floridanum]|uniref:uncharacterized protein LOC106644989 n=1 Tax=Copidosoma floridanum TaxID=29053 RepID=UPI0006C9D67E|nr:uncharacterized protein LOC106644989 [Copidosoma floridanum]
MWKRMTMLQFGGALVCSNSRRTPRLSWWITAQNFLYSVRTAQTAATAAATANTSHEAEPAKVPLEEKVVEHGIQSQKNPYPNKRRMFTSKALLTATFKSLSITAENAESDKIKELNERVRAAQTVDEILAVTDDPEFNKQNAATIIPILYNWISDDKVKISDLQTNNKFWKAFNKLSTYKRPPLYRDYDDPLSQHSNLQIEKINNLNTYQLITVLSKLASKQQRITPLLQAVTAKIADSNDYLNVKLLADVLYSVAVLTFYNNVLMEKISKDLLDVIPSNENSAVIGSILRSIGVLRYRDESLLDSLSTWIVDHKEIIRPQEIHNFFMTLAHLGYVPKNFNELLQKIVLPLKESDMCDSSEWLDVIWALTILNQATNVQFESVLNSGFLNRLFDTSEYSIPKSLKILNINAAAQLLPDYKGSLLPKDSPLFDITLLCSKEKRDLSNSVNSALKILSPANSINLNINTKMGFSIDAEICVDSKCSPVPISAKSVKQKGVFRIAILTCCYHDFCRGVTEVVGPMKFYCKLLQIQGYKIMIIPYTDVNFKDKLIQRVQYINDNIKKLVKVSSK